MKQRTRSSKSDAPELAELVRIGVQLQNLNHSLERRFGLSLVQWSVLRKLIDMPATSARKLAAAIGIHPSTLTQSVHRLERKGYLFASQDPRDARKKMLVATREGKAAADALALVLSKIDTGEDWGPALGTVESVLAGGMLLVSTDSDSRPIS